MFPLNKLFVTSNHSKTTVLSNYTNHTEIPEGQHPGAFGVTRMHHRHEGVDLYCEDGDEVLSMFSGKVIAIGSFTGVYAGSPWWNDTSYVLVEHDNFVLNYGEIIPGEIYVGKFLEEGDVIGNVKRVLKKDKGRPMSMLHLEMYLSGTKDPIMGWDLACEKPSQLVDPTPMLRAFLSSY